jgi:hypothetical protein
MIGVQIESSNSSPGRTAGFVAPASLPAFLNFFEIEKYERLFFVAGGGDF